MTDEMIALGKRAVACRGWRWMPGMLHGTPTREGIAWTTRYSDLGLHVDADRVPDLSDPATMGCLLALVREAWADEYACVLPVDYGPGGSLWVCRLTASGREVTRSVWRGEVHALVAALEAAPKRGEHRREE